MFGILGEQRFRNNKKENADESTHNAKGRKFKWKREIHLREIFQMNELCMHFFRQKKKTSQIAPTRAFELPASRFMSSSAFCIYSLFFSLHFCINFQLIETEFSQKKKSLYVHPLLLHATIVSWLLHDFFAIILLVNSCSIPVSCAIDDRPLLSRWNRIN